jgi:hypothetical protein
LAQSGWTPGRPTPRLRESFRAVASVCIPAGCRLSDQLLTDARRLPLKCDPESPRDVPSAPIASSAVSRFSSRAAMVSLGRGPGSRAAPSYAGANRAARPLVSRAPYRPGSERREAAGIFSEVMSGGKPCLTRWPSAKAGRVDNLRILLLDDVMSTGGTLEACSRALRVQAPNRYWDSTPPGPDVRSVPSQNACSL